MVELETPTKIVTDDHILGTVFWINEETLGAIWMNRRQNQAIFVSYDTTTKAMNEVKIFRHPITNNIKPPQYKR